MKCYCQSGKALSQCCQPIIIGEKIAKSPEQLMRSRYSAYALKQANYIYNTYAKNVRIAQSVTEINDWCNAARFTCLVVHHASPFSLMKSTPFETNENSYPTVEFSAFFHQEGCFYQIREVSRFTIENSRWYYLDGDIKMNQELTVKRNQACPCMGGKKYKQCCL